jgi:hypothetical protein
MKLLAYIGVAAGCLAIVLAINEHSSALLFLGIVSALCGAIMVAVCKIAERLTVIEDRLAQLAKQSPSPEDIVDQLRQEGLLQGRTPLDDDSVEELMEE